MAGRPMKPVPRDVPKALAEFSSELRELVERSVPEGKPLGTLAERSGLSRSTFFHALSGQRLPKWDTVLVVLNACESARPDLPDRTDLYEAWEQKWRRVKEELHAPVPVEPLLYFRGHGTADTDTQYLRLQQAVLAHLEKSDRVEERLTALQGQVDMMWATTKEDGKTTVTIVEVKDSSAGAEESFRTFKEEIGRLVADLGAARDALRASVEATARAAGMAVPASAETETTE